ncbi:MAG: hypothetical protein CO137_03425 [Candidatus Magasanikbacteria bacterium CG_4_9_14_3_um_filter_32_9]|uniref:Uncharacterized protein n=1 Tax=Candidatus Magasanikbacteria bacterium CG_4_9_14_3_um_filter_32_9 TaxID=1974644 RepID=A0A2M7Z643_9BACT|nr:MAG: hypothetical protein CO137_03425 [Candidatus Magasanikbacteria bacterium CG_4_9_14_3_um_filter_32_9]PJC42623.1 MAG: hypothetical protein CO040_03495 [Candidatus Pacebacteria bacterium CG_4_9_14_0_2_um_filter_36_8]
MIVVYFVNLFLEVYFSIYDLVPNFDVLMHTIGGIITAWSACLFFRIFEKRKLVCIEPAWALAFVLVLTTGAIGIFWEFYEWLYDLTAVYKNTSYMKFRLVNMVV